MLSRIKSYGLIGLNGYAVTVEIDVSGGMPAYETVGLPDAAVRESKERVRAAIKNSGFTYPIGRITVNLAPADMKKEGSIYDLPIALGIISATGQLKGPMPDYIYLGELALDGSIRGIHGLLPMVISASAQGYDTFVVPAANAPDPLCLSAAGHAVFPRGLYGRIGALLEGGHGCGGDRPERRQHRRTALHRQGVFSDG